MKKINKFNLIIFLLLLLLGAIDLGIYVKDTNKRKIAYNKIYEQCLNKERTDYICNNYKEEYKNRDALNTFAYVTIVSNGYSLLQTLSPLLIIIPSTLYFHSRLRNDYLKNSMMRIGYKKSIKNIYLQSLKSAFIMPIFLIITFIACCIISGNFDYSRGVSDFHFDLYEVRNTYQMIIFLIIYMLNFILHGIFWINIGIYNASHNKSKVIAIIVSYIEYFLMYIILERIGLPFFRGTDIYILFLLAHIWTFSYNKKFLVLIISILLASISTFVVYITYKNKEKILEEISK